MAAYDLLIDDALVVDGTGAPANRGAAATRGGEIGAVGQVAGEATKRSDADGAVMARFVPEPCYEGMGLADIAE